MKKIFLLVLTLVMIITSACLVSADAPSVSGDVNADGAVNAEDALDILLTAAGFNETSIEIYLSQDTNEDLKINAKDALNVLKVSAKLINDLEISKEISLNRVKTGKERLFFEEVNHTKANVDAYNSFVEANMIATDDGYTFNSTFLQSAEGDMEGIDETTVFTGSAIISIDEVLYICLIKNNENERLADVYVVNADGENYTIKYSSAMRSSDNIALFIKESGEGFAQNINEKAYCKGYVLSKLIGTLEFTNTLFEIELPESINYVDYFDNKEQNKKWSEDFAKKRALYGEEERDSLNTFVRNTAPVILSKNDGENQVYSPINVYMALGMLSEVTAGNSRAQLLNLSGAKTVEELRSEVKDVWNSHYRNDGSIESILGNSMWLRDDVKYNENTLNILSKDYYASSFSGEMGSESYNEVLRGWLNEQTKGLLGDSVKSIELPDDGILALASTIYYRGRWQNEFKDTYTEKDIFYSNGKEITCDFMNKKKERYNYYESDGFSAIKEDIVNAGGMWFIRPDENSSVNEVIASDAFMDFILSDGKGTKAIDSYVNLKVPKFDVSADIDMIETLKEIGVTDILEFDTADFSPLCDIDARIKLSKLNHAARVSIDEEGCIATAFTLAVMIADSAPTNHVDFILDKPFIFVITSENGAPLFMGVVNTPN